MFRFKSDKGSSNYFRESGILGDSLGEKASYESEKLKSFASYYATKMSYENVSELLEKRTGNDSISDQRVQQIVIEESIKIGKKQAEIIEKCETVSMPILGKADLYDTLIDNTPL